MDLLEQNSSNVFHSRKVNNKMSRLSNELEQQKKNEKVDLFLPSRNKIYICVKNGLVHQQNVCSDRVYCYTMLVLEIKGIQYKGLFLNVHMLA